MRQNQQPFNENELLSKFAFSETERRYRLIDHSFAKMLVDFKVGTKISGTQKQHAWVVIPEQFIYLISCLNVSPEMVVMVYSLMTPLQIDKSIFYMWMRKKSRMLKVKDQQTYYVFMNFEAFNANKPSYSIKLYQSDSLILTQLQKQKCQCEKIAIIRNRDIVVFDVIS